MTDIIRSVREPSVKLSASNTVHVDHIGEVTDHTGLEMNGAVCPAVHHALYGLTD